jgi:two-component system, OmpR family, phosphate regulon sensor histidine kinase PhoR
MAWYQYFPKKSVRRFIISQAVFLFIFSIIILLSIRHFVSGKIAISVEMLRVGPELEAYSFKLVLFLFVSGMLYSLWLAYDHFYPLGRLLEKAKNIKRGTYKRQWNEEMEAGHDYGEWYELELTLNKINREITKRKQDNRRRESEIETLAGAVSDGVIAIDTVKKVQYFNGPMALILGKTLDPLSPPSYLDEVFRAPKLTITVDEVISTGQPRRIQIQMRPHKVSENHIYDVIVTPVRDEKRDDFYGVIAVFHDVTETKKVEEVRIDFVANASHELKTPLTSIKGFVDVLAQDLNRSDIVAAKERLSVIHRNVDRLNDLVKDLLELSRLDAADEAVKEEIFVEEFTQEMLRELRPLYDLKEQKIVVDYDIPVVRANRLMLGQVMSNLLENANKYCDRQCKIHVRWFENDESIVLKVSDNGQGISEEHLSRLFERFYRVQASGKTRSGVIGTGLGLAIAKNCMLRQGGRIEVDSLPGRGTEFSCYFPKNS